MRNKALSILTLTLLITALAAAPAFADSSVSYHPVPLVAAQADYASIAVAQVSDYVNVRQEPNTGSAALGKMYNNSGGIILDTVSGENGEWYHIQSGSVTGYVKAEYFVTGSAAEALALQLGKEYVTVNADDLRLREAPDLDSEVLTLLSHGSRYLLAGTEGDFYKVEVDADLFGYLAKDFCVTEVEFDQAVTSEEEQQKIAEENQRKAEADEAIAALEVARQEAAAEGTTASSGFIEANPEVSDDSHSTTAPVFDNDTGSSGPTTVSGGPGSVAVTSATRNAIVAYAKQFLGNHYVYGGTRLTNGTDCSGFTMQIYAHFGIDTGRSSRDQAENGREIAISAAQPGDLLFYASGGTINHVAMYIGGGQIIHAATSSTGICIANYDYRTPCKAVTFLD